MPILNGEVIEADELMNVHGMMFRNQANLIWNADLIGIDSDLTENFKNLLYASLPEDKILSGTFTKAPWVSGSLIDEHNDSTVDTDIWSVVTNATGSVSSSVTENTSIMRLNCSGSSGSGPHSGDAQATADQTSAPNIGNQSLILKYSYSVGGTGVTGTGSIQIYDGTTAVNLVNHTANQPLRTIRVNIDKTNKTAGVSEDLTSKTETGISLASLNNANPWRIRYKITISTGSPWNGSSVMDVYVTRHLLASDSVEFTFGTGSSTTTVTNAILVTNAEAGTGASISDELSADNGSNFEEVTPDEIHRFEDTGTQVRYKTTLTASSDTYPSISKINQFAVGYNWY
jgi:hypothetical protein